MRLDLDVRCIVRLLLLLALAHNYVRGRHGHTAVLLCSSAWSTVVHAREVRCATNRWRDPAAGRHSHSGFRRNRACQQAQFLFCAVLTVPPRHGPVPLAGLCWLAWPVSELGGNGSSANTEQRGSRVNTYTCEHFGWFQDFCFGLWS